MDIFKLGWKMPHQFINSLRGTSLPRYSDALLSYMQKSLHVPKVNRATSRRESSSKHESRSSKHESKPRGKGLGGNHDDREFDYSHIV